MNNKKLYDVIECALDENEKKIPSYLDRDLKTCSDEIEQITRLTDAEEVQEILDRCSGMRGRLKSATKSIEIANVFDDFIKNVK